MVFRSYLARFVGIVWLGFAPLPGGQAAQAPIAGEYESARTADDEFVRLTLKAGGKAIIVAENNFQIPGDPEKRRGRTTSYAKWSRKGEIVTLRYSKITDRLRYDAATPLKPIGLGGAAPALTPIGKTDAQSRLRKLILWRSPHTYRLVEPVGAPASPAVAPR